MTGRKWLIHEAAARIDKDEVSRGRDFESDEDEDRYWSKKREQAYLKMLARTETGRLLQDNSEALRGLLREALRYFEGHRLAEADFWEPNTDLITRIKEVLGE